MKENNLNNDVVTYELAKKLKEKGFDSPCIYAYCEQGGWNRYKQVHEPITHILRTDGNPFGSFYHGKNWNVKYETNKNKIRCSAPTISQVLKWLRKEKKIFVSILPVATFSTIDKVAFYYLVEYNSTGELMTSIEQNTYCAEWEDAALAGIEYVLDNLI